MLWFRTCAMSLALVASACELPADNNAAVAGNTQAELGADWTWLTIEQELLQAVEHELAVELEPVRVVEGIALVEVPMSTVDDIAEVIHHRRGTCGGFMTNSRYDRALAAMTVEPLRRESIELLAGLTIDRPDEVAAVLGQLAESNVRSTISTLSAYPNRYYTASTGLDAAEWVADKWRSLAATRSDVSVTTISHSFLQPSVELRITGTTRPDEFVILGGHLDSISNGGASSNAPGADDNASGIAALTEVVRALLAADFYPERTIIVYGYAAEEVGLLGSQDIANRAESEGWNVIGVMQLDMVNYAGSSTDMEIVTDYTTPALTSYLEQLIDTYVGARHVRNQCGYACSDHASWYSAGFPVAHPFETAEDESNPYLHTPNDTLAASGGDAQHAMLFVKLGAAFAVELAKGRLGTSVECSAANPCSDGYSCQQGTCVQDAPECSAANPCSDGYSCDQGSCVEIPPQCDASHPCPTGYNCELGSCVAEPPECGIGDPCQDGYSCQQGSCEQIPAECDASHPCPDDYSCREQVCVQVPSVGPDAGTGPGSGDDDDDDEHGVVGEPIYGGCAVGAGAGRGSGALIGFTVALFGLMRRRRR